MVVEVVVDAVVLLGPAREAEGDGEGETGRRPEVLRREWLNNEEIKTG